MKCTRGGVATGPRFPNHGILVSIRAS